MKVRVKAPYFDGTIHKKGDVIETDNFDSALMEILEVKKEDKVEKAVAKTPKKTTRKKV